MEVREDSEPVARRNRIHENKQSGVRAYENGRGTYEDNDIFSNGHAGVRVQSGAAPLMRGNRINKNGYEAIWVSDAGAGIYEDNDLRENTRGPWDIEASASAELKRTQNIEN
jgi:F-box protein 11